MPEDGYILQSTVLFLDNFKLPQAFRNCMHVPPYKFLLMIMSMITFVGSVKQAVQISIASQTEKDRCSDSIDVSCWFMALSDVSMETYLWLVPNVFSSMCIIQCRKSLILAVCCGCNSCNDACFGLSTQRVPQQTGELAVSAHRFSSVENQSNEGNRNQTIVECRTDESL